jgi:hypothetical protein
VFVYILSSQVSTKYNICHDIQVTNITIINTIFTIRDIKTRARAS